MERVNLTKIQKEDGTTVWTLRGANSEGVMQIRQQAGGRDNPDQLVSVEIPLTTWSPTDLQRAATLLVEVAGLVQKQGGNTHN
jgi:hypothetical protein